MKLVFDLDGVICTPPKGIQYGVVTWVDKCKPIANAIEFMQWLKKGEHEIIIWCKRPNDLAVKFATEQWLDIQQVPYDRLLFDHLLWAAPIPLGLGAYIAVLFCWIDAYQHCNISG